MKCLKLSFSIILFTLFLCGCRHNDAKDLYINYPIQKEIETSSKVIDWDILSPDEKKQYPSISFVINSQDDFPERDLMDLENIKSLDIDFEKYTLLLCYKMIPGKVIGHRYIWRKNIQEDVFELFTDFSIKPWGSDTTADDDSGNEKEPMEDDLTTYYCTALLVQKIPVGAKVVFWYGHYFY